jgi:hypothetical protein
MNQTLKPEEEVEVHFFHDVGDYGGDKDNVVLGFMRGGHVVSQVCILISEGNYTVKEFKEYLKNAIASPHYPKCSFDFEEATKEEIEELAAEDKTPRVVAFKQPNSEWSY